MDLTAVLLAIALLAAPTTEPDKRADFSGAWKLALEASAPLDEMLTASSPRAWS